MSGVGSGGSLGAIRGIGPGVGLDTMSGVGSGGSLGAIRGIGPGVGLDTMSGVGSGGSLGAIRGIGPGVGLDTMSGVGSGGSLGAIRGIGPGVGLDTMSGVGSGGSLGAIRGIGPGVGVDTMSGLSPGASLGCTCGRGFGPKAQLCIVMDVTYLATNGERGRCEIPGVGAIARSELERLGCDAEIYGILFDERGLPPAPRPQDQKGLSPAVEGAACPRPRMRHLRCAPQLVPGSPRQVLVAGRAHRHRQLGAAVPRPPPLGSRQRNHLAPRPEWLARPSRPALTPPTNPLLVIRLERAQIGELQRQVALGLQAPCAWAAAYLRGLLEQLCDIFNAYD